VKFWNMKKQTDLQADLGGEVHAAGLGLVCHSCCSVTSSEILPTGADQING
jgi:hypothetical protein